MIKNTIKTQKYIHVIFSKLWLRPVRYAQLSLVLCSGLLANTVNADQGITSEVHNKNVGKIIFTTDLNAIAFKKEIPSLFKSAFNGSDSIYARVYLEKSIANTLHGDQKSYQSTLMWDLKINGKKIRHKRSYGMYRHIPQSELTYFTEYLDGGDKFSQWTSWRPYLLPKEDDSELKYGNVNIAARSFTLALMDLPIGEHNVELSLFSKDMSSNNNSAILAKGAFKLSLTKKDKTDLAFKYVPPLPKNTWQGGNEKQLIEELTNAFANEINKQPLLIGLYGKNWSEGTYKLTGQKYRKLAAWAIFNDTDNDGQVPITTFNWISDYSSGSWTALRFDSHCNGCPDWDVEIEAVKHFIKTK